MRSIADLHGCGGAVTDRREPDGMANAIPCASSDVAKPVRIVLTIDAPHANVAAAFERIRDAVERAVRSGVLLIPSDLAERVDVYRPDSVDALRRALPYPEPERGTNAPARIPFIRKRPLTDRKPTIDERA